MQGRDRFAIIKLLWKNHDSFFFVLFNIYLKYGTILIGGKYGWKTKKIVWKDKFYW
jgi:hypothetical protein